MINKNRESKGFNDAFEKALLKLKQVGYTDIKADYQDFERPPSLINQRTQESFVPDITAVSDDRKHYFEISQKNDPNDLLVSKWKLLEVMAKMRNGTFKIFAPKGTIKFTEGFVDKYNIKAEIIRL